MRAAIGLCLVHAAVAAYALKTATNSASRPAAIAASPAALDGTHAAVMGVVKPVQARRSFIPGLGALLRARRARQQSAQDVEPCVTQVCLGPATADEISAGRAAKGTQTLTLKLGDAEHALLT
eukprot:1928672-Prymnesium_polylepis.1